MMPSTPHGPSCPQLLAQAAPVTLGTWMCHHLMLTSPLFLLSELAYDLDMDDTSATKQLLNQQSKDSATVPRSTGPHPRPAAAIALVLLLPLGSWL